jgi:hypothetical protein
MITNGNRDAEARLDSSCGPQTTHRHYPDRKATCSCWRSLLVQTMLSAPGPHLSTLSINQMILTFPHGDGASVVSSAAPFAAGSGSSSGSKSSTRLFCISLSLKCYAPRRIALLRTELYRTPDDLEKLSAHLPDAGADGAWKAIPSLATSRPPHA